MYFKPGRKDKAITAAQNLPHFRESREHILAELKNEPDTSGVKNMQKHVYFDIKFD